MWITLFSIVIGIALGLSLGAVVLESYEEGSRVQRRRPARLRS